MYANLQLGTTAMKTSKIGTASTCAALFLLFSGDARSAGTDNSKNEIGFTCVELRGPEKILFNINLGKSTIRWESGNLEGIIIRDNEISVDVSPFTYMIDKVTYFKKMNRTSLVYEDGWYDELRNTGDLKTYQCEIVAAHEFGGHRRF